MALKETSSNDGTAKKRPASEVTDNGADNDDVKRAKTRDGPSEALNSVGRDHKGQTERWRAHQLAEDYVNVVNRIMYTSQNQQQQPHQVMALSRPVTILELWNPREIALFEAGLHLHGKQFHKVQRLIQSKTTKDVVAFYYIWKKTSHYTQWKQQYTSSGEESDSESEVEE